MLNNKIDFEACTVLDLFSGTGSISLEFASRKVISVTAVDLNFKCVDFLRKTAQDLKLDNIKTIKANVLKFLSGSRKVTFDVVFADPPYDMEALEQIPDLIFENQFLKKDGLFILEHSGKSDFEDHPHFIEHRKYGNVNFSFFR